jgi:MoaA/NifB/PqqE/SkfB family radical SAM enzyme
MMPKVVLIATGSPCNAKCPHCPCTVKPEIRRTNDLYLRLEYFAKICDECAGQDVHIRLSGYGEPFLHPFLFDMLEYGISKGCKLSLITNGSLIAPHIEKLANMGLESIEISADSHKKEIYEKIRVGLDFDQVLQNIDNLVSVRNYYNKKTAIMVSIIDQPSRNPDIQGAVDYYSKIVDKVLVRKYATWGVLPAGDQVKASRRSACPYPWERLMIDPEGNFRLCPYDDQRKIDPLGHIKDQSIEEVFNSERFNQIRKGHKTGHFDFIELCGECTDWVARSWDRNYRSALKEVQDDHCKA